MKNNKVANLLKILSIIVLCIGIIISLKDIAFIISFAEESIFSKVILPLIITVTSALFIYALGEIIQLLEDIKNK